MGEDKQMLHRHRPAGHQRPDSKKNSGARLRQQQKYLLRANPGRGRPPDFAGITGTPKCAYRRCIPCGRPLNFNVIWRAPRPCGACPTQPFNAVKMLKSKSKSIRLVLTNSKLHKSPQKRRFEGLKRLPRLFLFYGFNG